VKAHCVSRLRFSVLGSRCPVGRSFCGLELFSPVGCRLSAVSLPVRPAATLDRMDPLSAHPEGTEVLVWVVPGASRTEITGLHDGALRIRVAAPPEGGKANKAVVATLAFATGASARLLAGAAARRKRVLIEGLSERQVRAALDL